MRFVSARDISTRSVAFCIFRGTKQSADLLLFIEEGFTPEAQTASTFRASSTRDVILCGSRFLITNQAISFGCSRPIPRKYKTVKGVNENSATSIETAERFKPGDHVKHKIDDEIRVKVTHDHDFDKEDVEDIIDKLVRGAVIVIAASTAAHVVKRVVR